MSTTNYFSSLYQNTIGKVISKYDEYQDKKLEEKQIINRSGFHDEMKTVEEHFPKYFDHANRKDYAWAYFMANCTGFDCFYSRFEKINEEINNNFQSIDSDDADKIDKFKKIVEKCHEDDGITNHYS